MPQFSQEKLEEFMRLALQLVDEAVAQGNGPFAAILIDQQGEVIESALNTSYTDHNVAAHAEINLLGLVGEKRKLRNLEGYGVVVNAAPCSMCMSALVKAKIAFLIYGADTEIQADPSVSPREVLAKSQHQIEVHPGILLQECTEQILQARARRA